MTTAEVNRDPPAPRPLITIGIPCFNRPAFLRAALASIAAQETRIPIDIVVSDDGGLAETARVIAECGLPVRHFVNRPPLGPVRNWNRCIELANTLWVTVLHDDDLLYPWFLTVVTPRLRDGVAAVAVRCVQGPEPTVIARPAGKATIRRYAPIWFLKASMTPFPGVVFAKRIADQIGSFDPDAAGIADYQFWYELSRRGRIEVVRSIAAFYRVNPGQWTEQAWPAMLRRAHLLRLRVAREQLGTHSRLGRWLARFYTARMARAYARRFSERPATLLRAQRFERIPLSRLPSGWVWAFLRFLARFTPDKN